MSRNVLSESNCGGSKEKEKQLFLKLGFIPCKAEQPLQDMELKEKETQKD